MPKWLLLRMEAKAAPLPGFLDDGLHRLLAQAHAHTALCVEDERYRRLTENGGVYPRLHDSTLQSIHVAPEPAHSVARDATSIGGHEDLGRIARFFLPHSQGDKDIMTKSLKILSWHPLLCIHPIVLQQVYRHTMTQLKRTKHLRPTLL